MLINKSFITANRVCCFVSRCSSLIIFYKTLPFAIAVVFYQNLFASGLYSKPALLSFSSSLERSIFRSSHNASNEG